MNKRPLLDSDEPHDRRAEVTLEALRRYRRVELTDEELALLLDERRRSTVH